MIGGIGGFTPQASTSKPAAPWYSMREGLPSNSKKTEEAAETEEGEEGEEVAEEE
jgi:hypothetical protein